ncbi:GNAT family N-acetyltransferase [Streptomyces antimicrobicus]|uniref:GNAT family N-acetyltransferase n=1 Tax=Streptomyces antimicrobicus TaxID=2883108 RepID=A0ABS8BDA5_9ACTN|nr:GNAT family N-acetyltransferase [Streptomyces antimicrobicus]MCB5182576.1 GNAT family N-acetyltransferase [Streptomyces antimicrobicus]
MSERTITLTTWSLAMDSPAELVPATAPGPEVRIERAEVPSPEFSRFLYASVGGDIHWTDRLGLTRAEWLAHLDRPGVETWVAYDRGTPAGYVELDPQDDGVVEIVYFGLLPDFRGRRIGGHLLTVGTARAWDLASRWPGRAETTRVWLHTCSQDGPTAMDNYLKRGFKVFRTETEEKPETATPGPWPGA